jgi:hypothetical protein
MIFERGTQSVVLLSALALTAFAGCRKSTDDEDGQIGAAVGEVMSGVDESTQGGTTTAMLPALPVHRLPDELRAPAWKRAAGALLPSAYAAACGDTTFSACSNGVRTRTFSDCTVGLATVSGQTSLTFSSAPACVFLTAGDMVTRMADLTVTGLYGGSLVITSPGGGQTLTKTATGFEYTVPGMERVLTSAAGRQLFDVSTKTTAPVEITGSSRADLVIVSGTLEVTHHLAGYTVDLTPNNLTWNATCNCAVSGSLSGTVTGGKHDGKMATVTITGCGEADVDIDGQTTQVSLDRCTSI